MITSEITLHAAPVQARGTVGSWKATTSWNDQPRATPHSLGPMQEDAGMVGAP